MMLNGMNAGHSIPADWRNDHLPFDAPPAAAVYLRCRAERNAGELLKKNPQIHVKAVDYSP